MLRFPVFPALVLSLSGFVALEASDRSASEDWITNTNQQAMLDAGQVAILESTGKAVGEDAPHAVTAAILIDAPVTSVWNVLNDQDRAPHYMKTLVSSELLETHEGYSLLQQKVKVGFHQVTYVVKHMPEAPSVIQFERVSGDLKSMGGFWRLIESGEKTLVIYRLSLQPDFPLPAFLIRKSLTENLPETLISVKDEVQRQAANS